MEHSAARAFQPASSGRARRRPAWQQLLLPLLMFAAWLLAPATAGIDAARAQARPAAAEKRIALVIGNARYPAMPLGNPENDARLIADNLRKLGFQVNEQLNLNVREFRRVLREFARRLQEDDAIAVLYYAGHGVQIDGRNYLLPTDINLRDQEEVKDESVDIDELFLSRLDKARSHPRIVILDACRDNPFAAKTRNIRSAGGLAEMGARGTLIAYASAPGAPAEDGPFGKNSVYTKNLAQEMMVPGLEVEQMFKNVRVKVLRDTRERQVPWVNTSLTSNFSFNPVSGASPEEAAREAQIRQLEAELQQTRKALEESRAAIRAAAAAAAIATPAPAPPPAPAVAAARPPKPAAPAPAPAPTAVAMPAAAVEAAEAARANELSASRLEAQLERARLALAAVRAESRAAGVAAAPQPAPAALSDATEPPQRSTSERQRGCRDLLSRASIGDQLSPPEITFLKQECK